MENIMINDDKYINYEILKQFEELIVGGCSVIIS